MQIGLYFYSDGLGLSINTILYNLKPEILKENFDAYSQVIPEGDTPYYRGIILRGATVYLCEFVQEKNNRELQELEKQLAPDDQKNFEPAQIKKVPSNNKVNDNIYRQINGLRDAAFISVLTIPTVIIIVMIIIMIFSWVISIG